MRVALALKGLRAEAGTVTLSIPLSVSLQAVTFDLSIGTTDPFIVSVAFGLVRARPGQGVIDFLLGRDLEDAGCGRINQQVQIAEVRQAGDDRFAASGTFPLAIRCQQEG